MEQLGPLDAAFWQFENSHVALHIGGIAIFDGPPPAADVLAARYLARIEAMPRYRQKMRSFRFSVSRPVWVDDPKFDVTYHLRRTAIPAPGGEDELLRLVGRLMSNRLDDSRPLWEAWVIEGLADDRWALLSKVHHSMVDGVAGMDLFTGLLDMASAPVLTRAPRASHVPVGVQLAVGAIEHGLRGIGSTAGGAAGAIRHPGRSALRAAHNAAGALRLARAIRPATATSLTGPLGTPRRYRVVTIDASDVSRVRAALGGSVNDVALAVVTRGFHDLLISRGEPPGPRTVRCLVPVSVRVPTESHDLANRVSAMLVDLPVDFHDPAAAYGAVRARMRQLKRSHEADAGELATELAGHLPAPLVAATLRAALRLPHRVITTVTTNVPGPTRTAHLLGRRMVALYPYVPIADQIRIGVALTSYEGHLHFGITCDRDSVPDVDVLTGGMTAGMSELVKAAEAAS
jgi:WS/DGAT/MGAT family acyltransferase